MSNLPRYESWPPTPGGPAPSVPSQAPAYGYGAPSWQQPTHQPTPILARQRPSNVVPIVLAVVAAPAAVLLLLVLVSGLFMFAPVAAVAAPAGAVMIAVCRPRRSSGNRRQADAQPAPTGRPTHKTAPPLSHYQYKKG